MRLELIKLAHRHDHQPEQVVARAEVFEQYVLRQADNPPPQGRLTAGKDRGQRRP